MTELPYTALSLAALACAARGAPLRAGLLAGLAALTRTVGLVLVAALVASLVLPRRDRRGALLRAAPALALLGPWWVRQAVVGSSLAGDYAQEALLADPYGASPNAGAAAHAWAVAMRMLGALPDLAHHLGQSLFFYADVFGRPFAIALGAAAAVPCAVGLARRLRAGPGPAEWYTLGFTGVLIAWPWHDQRFLLPLVPVLYLYLVEGAAALWPRPRALAVAAALPVVTGLATLTHFVAIDLARGQSSAPEYDDLTSVAAWVREAPHDARFVYDRPAELYLLADRPAAPTNLVDPHRPLFASGATHLVLAPVTPLDEGLYRVHLLPRLRDLRPPPVWVMRTPRGGVVALAPSSSSRPR
jgi:hypothetical protein